jgi:hypothetical protein
MLSKKFFALQVLKPAELNVIMPLVTFANHPKFSADTKTVKSSKHAEALATTTLYTDAVETSSTRSDIYRNRAPLITVLTRSEPEMVHFFAAHSFRLHANKVSGVARDHATIQRPKFVSMTRFAR